MSSASPDCRAARLKIGADPQGFAPEVAAHLATCAECDHFRAEMLALDARVKAALELPLPQFRQTAARPAVRRFALAASVLLALFVAGGFWLLRPQSALAAEVIEHVTHEAGSWEERQLLPASAVAAVLRTAGVRFDTSLPVVYAMTCEFRGHRVPHLVVQTASGPMTVMLLAHEKVTERTEFSENGFHGVLLPARGGAVAVLTRGGEVPEASASSIVNGVRW